MTICSCETPTFNIISGTFYISQKNVINGKFLAHKYSHTKIITENMIFHTFYLSKQA